MASQIPERKLEPEEAARLAAMKAGVERLRSGAGASGVNRAMRLRDTTQNVSGVEHQLRTLSSSRMQPARLSRFERFLYL